MSRANVRRLFGDLARRVTRDDTVLVVLLGHGTFDGADAKSVIEQWRAWSADLPELGTTSFALFQLPDMPGVPPVLAERLRGSGYTAGVDGRLEWADRAEGVVPGHAATMRARAEAVLAKKESADPAWTCGCGERLGGQFTQCWSCGAYRP